MKTSNPLKRYKYIPPLKKPISAIPMIPGDGLKDVLSGVSSTCVISGTRYGIVNGAVTQFAVNQPPIEDYGLRGCPAFTQYFLNNETPVTQSITLAAGSYCLWIEGSGSATFNGLTATAGVPKVFTLASGFTGNCVITGTVTKAMLNSGLFPAPFSPTLGITKSFVAETATSSTGTSFDLDDVKLTRLKTALRGPNAQGHLEVELLLNFNKEWKTTNTQIISVNNDPTGDFLYYGVSGSAWTMYDTAANKALSIMSSFSVGQSIKFVLDWGTHSTGQKMRITVNGVKSSLSNFSGSFGTQDMRFFYNNTVHAGWIKKDSLKIFDRPIW